APEQDERSRHDTAAQHAIELADAAWNLLRRGGFDVRVPLRTARRRTRQRVAMRLGSPTAVDHALFDQRVPRAAVRTAPLPLGRLRAAFLADENRLRRFHPDHRTISNARHRRSSTRDNEAASILSFGSRMPRARAGILGAGPEPPAPLLSSSLNSPPAGGAVFVRSSDAATGLDAATRCHS